MSALYFVILKRAGDRQTVKDYDKQYRWIQQRIRDMVINADNYKFIESCIKELEKLPYKNHEKTSALYRELEGMFKKKVEQHIEDLKETVYI
jgi:predicted RNA-binding protein with RPS1 domain